MKNLFSFDYPNLKLISRSCLLSPMAYCLLPIAHRLSGTWRDYTAAWKSCLVKLIKWLALQGYCKKARLTPAEIRAICVNTFNTEEVSLSTIHHVHPAPDEFAHLFPSNRCTSMIIPGL